MYEIMKLSGQEYVDIYATAAKRQLAEAEEGREKAAKARTKAEKAAGRRGRTQAEGQTERPAA